MNFNDYENKVSYPKKSDFTTKYYYKAGKVVATIRTSDPAALMCLNGCVQESVVDEVAFAAAKVDYGKITAQLAEMFIVDLLQDFGLPDNEFTRDLYRIAYANGHSSGYSSIYNHFSDLSDLDALAKKVYGK